MGIGSDFGILQHQVHLAFLHLVGTGIYSGAWACELKTDGRAARGPC